jgi:uncharacterized protein (TIRG00374 family)
METEMKNFLSGISFDNTFKKLLLLMPLGILGMFLFSYFAIKKDLANLLHGFSYFYLLVALLLSFVPWITHTVRMYIWNRFLKLKIPFNELFKISLGTELGAAITPTSMGGGPVKMGMLVQQKVSAATSLFLTILGSVEDWTFFLMIIPFSFIMLQSEHMVNYHQLASNIYHSSLFVGFAATLGLLFVITLLKPTLWRNLAELLKRAAFFRKLFEKLGKMIFDMKQVFRIITRHGKRYFALSMLVTCIQWVSRYSIVYFLLCGLGHRHNPFELFLLQVIVYLMMTIIPTPGSAIGAEASFYYIFQSIIPNDLIGFLTAGWRMLTYYFPILMAAIFFLLWNYRLLLKPKNAAISAIQPPTLKSNVQLT